MISRESSWRHLGAVPLTIWQKRINDAGGLSEAAERRVWGACGDDSALMLAFLRAESSYGSHFDAIPASFKNPWNLQLAGQGLRFSSIEAAANAWRERLYSTTYKGGIYTNAETISDLIYTYAPPTDGNDTEGYIAKVVAEINRNGFDPPVTTPSTPAEPTTSNSMWLEKEPTMATPATIDYSSLPFPVEVRFIPVGQIRQRTRIPMTPQWSTWHDTDNPNAGANAEMHARWMADGCRDQYGYPTDTSWHFTVDDGKAIQHIPLNEVAWHAGDGAGPGNYTSLAIEECVNSDRDVALTRRNAQMLHALLIEKLGLQGGSEDALVQHNKWSGKNCPKVIRNAGIWPQMKAAVAGYISSGSGTAPTYADASPIPKGSQIVNGHVFLAPGGKTVQRDVVPAKWADSVIIATGPIIKKGTKLAQEQIAHYVVGTEETPNIWVELVGVPGVKDGSRIPASALVA